MGHCTAADAGNENSWPRDPQARLQLFSSERDQRLSQFEEQREERLNQHNRNVNEVEEVFGNLGNYEVLCLRQCTSLQPARTLTLPFCGAAHSGQVDC